MPKATHDQLIREALVAGELSVNPDTGDVECCGRGPAVQQNGYATLTVRGKTVMAHRVVWLSAHPHTPVTLEINHRNLCRWDNRLANLEAVTRQGNANHAWANSYVAVASSAEEMDGNSVDPEWFEQVMALAASGDVTPEQVQALKPERLEKAPRPYAKIRYVRG